MADTDWRAGVQLLKQGKTDEAVAALEQAADADPDSLEALMYLGMALAQCGRAQEGAAKLQRAVEIDPGNTMARFNLGCVLERAGDDSTAVEAFESVLQVNPNHAKAQQALQKARARIEEAASALEPEQELAPLGGEPQAEPDTASEEPPSPPPAPPKPEPSAPRRKSGSAATVIIPIAALLLVGGAAAAYFLLFASSPAKVATNYWTAMQAQDLDALGDLCTAESQELIGQMQQAANRVKQRGMPKGMGGTQQIGAYEVGEVTKQGKQATVMTKVTNKVPPMFAAYLGGSDSLELQVPVCLVKEGLNWKVDLRKTSEEQGKAVIAAIGPDKLQELGKAAMKAFSKSGGKMPRR